MVRGGPLQRILVALACVMPILQSVTHAAITADHLVVLANGNSPHSVAVAQYYADRRHIARSHVISLDVPDQENLSREQYERHVAGPLRRALQDRGLTRETRVLVTTFGIPLRVLAVEPNEQQQGWARDAEARYQAGLARLEIMEQDIRHLGISQESAVAKVIPSPPPAPSRTHESVGALDTRLKRTGHEIRDAALRLKQFPASEQTAQDNQELSRLTLQFAGIGAVIPHLKASGAPEQEAEKLGFQATAAQLSIQALAQTPSDRNRARAYALAERVFGLQGLLRLAGAELQAFSMRDSDASLDSELSLLWWDPAIYHLAGRTPNPLYVSAAAPRMTPPSAQMPVLMVSRLDAPTAHLAMRLVDHAIEAEKDGLAGTVYLDARGLPPEPLPGFGYYDESLRLLAHIVQRMTSYRVVLENTDQRLSRPGEAAGTAVYVGWYRLRSYEDAFTFNVGAIGYHIASGEAISLHDPSERGWCKNALERGITVTLGSVGEPYLDAFPAPSRLIGLLLTGRYALVEAYYLTTPHVSWRMILIGDPLYNPWRSHAERADMPHNVVWEGALPDAPSVHPFPDPVVAIEDLHRRRDATLAQIDRMMPAP